MGCGAAPRRRPAATPAPARRCRRGSPCGRRRSRPVRRAASRTPAAARSRIISRDIGANPRLRRPARALERHAASARAATRLPRPRGRLDLVAVRVAPANHPFGQRVGREDHFLIRRRQPRLAHPFGKRPEQQRVVVIRRARSRRRCPAAAPRPRPPRTSARSAWRTAARAGCRRRRETPEPASARQDVGDERVPVAHADQHLARPGRAARAARCAAGA